ncbi:MAG TPA: acyl-CoA dehydrogenase family protein [Chloroflexia bacterium]|nr:acyl-CoA dehydrogenase family protein [Chloroflexia bacterium]
MDFELTAEQQHVQAEARRFAREEVAPLAREADESGEFPALLIGRMAELGFLGSTIQRGYGGSDLGYMGYALVCEELGRADSSVRGFLTVHAGLVAGCIQEWGTEEQKRHYLPKLASGEWIGCYALTEPNAGSDVAGMETTARQEGDSYSLTGEKIWITNALSAHLAIVFARFDPAVGDDPRPHRQIGAFLVETSTHGFNREPMPGKELGHRASEHAHITLEDCRVPASAMLGAAGEGFKVAMSALDRGRIGVAAGAVGVAQACLDASVGYARTRKQFGKRLGDFEMVQAVLADMAADVEAARLLTYRAAWAKQRGLPATKAASIAKLFATEAAVKAASEAVLLHGNRGYSNQYPVERYYRDIKGLQIYEGTSHIQRIIIARELVGRDNAE